MATFKDLLGEADYARLKQQAAEDGMTVQDWVVSQVRSGLDEAAYVPSNVNIHTATDSALSTFTQRVAVAEDIIDMLSTMNGGRRVRRGPSTKIKVNHLAKIMTLPPNKIAHVVTCIMTEAALNPEFRKKNP